MIGLQGIGHMYIGRMKKGVGILVSSILVFVGALFGTSIVAAGIGIVLFLVYVTMFVWQIFDARKSCRQYNLNIYKSFSTKYSQHKIQKTSGNNEYQNMETEPTKNVKNRSWSKTKIIVMSVVAFLVLSGVVVVTLFSNIPELIERSQQRESTSNSLTEYSQNYDRWSECVKNNDRSYCGDPPQSPFDSEPINCDTGRYDFRCNPYYTGTYSDLQGPP